MTAAQWQWLANATEDEFERGLAAELERQRTKEPEAGHSETSNEVAEQFADEDKKVKEPLVFEVIDDNVVPSLVFEVIDDDAAPLSPTSAWDTR